MTLDEVLSEWKEDSKIEMLNLDGESKRSPELHAKYLEELTNSKLKLRHLEFEQKKLMKDKWLWFGGKLDRDTIKEHGWKDDPFDGLKVMKSDLHYYVETDPQLVDSEAKIEYMKVKIETLREIVDNIKWRHTHIKNIIENRKFEAGF
jgi:hypothetical protein